MNNDTNRAAFERYVMREIGEQGDVSATDFMGRNAEGDYTYGMTDFNWSMWQAARAQPERVALSDTEIESLVEWMGDPHDPYFDRIKFARAIIAAQPITQPLIAEAARDDRECIELAQALEQSRATKIVEAVAALQIGGATSDMPTPFQSGFQLACEEITHRLRTEEWDLCLKPIEAAIADATPRKTGNPVMATRDDAMTALKKLHVGDSSFEGWFAEKDMRGLGTKQLCRDAYAAGMEDPVIAQLIAAVQRDDVAGDAALNQLREWFAEQRDAISKGCGSTWDMLQCDEQIDLIDAAIAAGKAAQ